MKSKLTISIEKLILAKAKSLSRKRKISLSKLFEEFDEEDRTDADSPASDAILGILKSGAKIE